MAPCEGEVVGDYIEGKLASQIERIFQTAQGVIVIIEDNVCTDNG